MNVFQVFENGMSLVEFVKGGGLEADLAEVELTAARKALRNVGRARDQRAQLWSVINHLETAEAGFAEAASKRGFINVAFRGYSREVAFTNLFIVRCLLVVCYVFVKEREHCRATVAELRQMLNVHSGLAQELGELVHTGTLLFMVNIATTKGAMMQMDEMRKRLLIVEKFVRSRKAWASRAPVRRK